MSVRFPKVERHCPRCRAHRYHFSTVNNRKMLICCAECGHQWRGRYRRTELDGVAGCNDCAKEMFICAGHMRDFMKYSTNDGELKS